MNVLVVEDELEYRDYLLDTIREWGNDVRGAESGSEALEILELFTPDVMVTDLMMPVMDGFELLRRLKKEERLPPAIVMTAFGSLEKALDVIHDLGGYWFVEKPVKPEVLALLLSRAAAQGRLAAENFELKRQLAFQGVVGEMVGVSSALQEVFTLIRQVAPTSAPVLITGESGTGKELVARALHSHSRRSTGPFVAVNCAAMPETLIESELFGHEKGSFTGAVERRIGALESAAGGTLFLDELGEMPLPMQAKLLRVLEDFHFRRVGGKLEIKADVRILAATNRDPKSAIQDGKLREDLYYRLNVFEIWLPPLRDRKEDIPVIVENLIHGLNRKHNARVAGATAAFMEEVCQREWKGNVRELRNVLERAVILAGQGELGTNHLVSVPFVETVASSSPAAAATPNVALDPALIQLKVGITIEEAEQALIEATLRHTANHKTKAATILGISAKTLHTKLRIYRSDNGDFPADEE